MNSCPNIARKEIRKRLMIGYIGLFATIATILCILLFDQGHLWYLVFFPAILTTVTFFEVLDKTCIVYAYLGIKNMGEKYQREKESDFLKVQRLQSLKIIMKALVTALLITGIVYLV